jgi:PAS domain S-box-containing protein
MSDQGGGRGAGSISEGEDRFRKLVDHHTDGIAVVGATGMVLYSNSAAREMLPSLEPDALFDFPLSAGDVTELDLSRPDGGAIVVELRVEEMSWGTATALLVTLRDITVRKRAQESVIEERQRLDRVIMGSADAIAFVSPDGEVLEWNPAAERMFGWTKPQALGSRMDELFVVEAEGDERSRRGERRQSVRKVVQRKRRDGTMFKAEITSSAVHDAFGGISRYVSVIRDVTEQTLIDAATAAMASELDPSQAVNSFARVVAEVFPFCQLSLAVIQDDHYRRVVSVSGVGGVSLPQGELVPLAGNPAAQAVATDLPVVCEDTARGRWPFDARLLEVGIRSYVVLPLTQEGHVFATFNVGFAEPDVPSPKMTSTLNALATAVSAGVKNILTYEAEHETVQRLEELDSLKNEFLAMVSHDLRNPLAVISGFADTMLEMWDKLQEEQKLNMLKAVQRNAVSLAHRVEQDLDVALIESGRFSFNTRAFDFGRTVRAAVQDAHRSFPDREFTVETESGLPQMIADEERTKQVLTNLLSNAVKYSPEGSPVEITVRRTELGLEASVTDRGEGIPEDQLQNLFQKLSRLEASRERVKGTGLGLYISKALVEGMGGRIRCESIAGDGSTFSVSLPAAGSGTAIP